MKVIYDSGKINYRLRNTVAAIGIFDGVHLGHQSLIRQMVAVGERNKQKTIVLTFYPHPAEILRNTKINYLTSLNGRIDLIKALGVDYVWVIKFTKRFARLQPREFVRKYLVERLGVKEVFVGDDFRFGENRTGDVKLFEQMGREYSFRVHHIQTIKTAWHKIGSSMLRDLILSGKLLKASRLMGRRVSVTGKVVKGKGLGKQLGFPTANLLITGGILPPVGVYVVRVFLGDKTIWGICNIGSRPSVFSENKKILLEVHLLDFQSNIYDKELVVEIIKKIRNEKKFPSLEKLTLQITKDERFARQYIKTVTN